MSLKSELQKISNQQIEKVSNSLTERLDSVSQSELEAEAIAAIINYPALNHLTVLVLEQGVSEGMGPEEALARGVGASQALLVLTTLAEINDLPALG